MARGTKVWSNGKIIPVEEAKISLFSHVIHYGTGAFEGIRAYKQTKSDGAVFRLKEHMERLEDSIKIMGFEIPFTTDQLVQGAIEACKANNFEECYIRPIAFIGDGPLGVFPGANPKIDVAILVWDSSADIKIKGQQVGGKTKGMALAHRTAGKWLIEFDSITPVISMPGN